MKKLIFCIMLIFLVTTTNNIGIISAQNKTTASSYTTMYKITMKRDILCLMMAYPGFIKNIERDNSGYVYLVMKSGRKILYDDKRVKSHDEKLANPDLQDMMEQIYPLSSITILMDKNFDPGRCRVYALFDEVYGNSRQHIESNLVSVNIGSNYFPLNSKNNASGSLNNIMTKLVPLAQKRKDIYNCVFPCSGTFNYRFIAGTNQLSAHSYGTAIDLAANNKDYWKWATREEGQIRLNSYPKEIAKIFEKNNFIWGGKWGSFDMMHYEYRPEIILKAMYFGNKYYDANAWYYGAPSQKKVVGEYILKINQLLR